jgi:hypothetical protein
MPIPSSHDLKQGQDSTWKRSKMRILVVGFTKFYRAKELEIDARWGKDNGNDRMKEKGVNVHTSRPRMANMYKRSMSKSTTLPIEPRLARNVRKTVRSSLLTLANFRIRRTRKMRPIYQHTQTHTHMKNRKRQHHMKSIINISTPMIYVVS